MAQLDAKGLRTHELLLLEHHPPLKCNAAHVTDSGSERGSPSVTCQVCGSESQGVAPFSLPPSKQSKGWLNLSEKWSLVAPFIGEGVNSLSTGLEISAEFSFPAFQANP